MHSGSPYLHVVTDTKLPRKVTGGRGDMKRTASLRDTQNATSTVSITRSRMEHACGIALMRAGRGTKRLLFIFHMSFMMQIDFKSSGTSKGSSVG